MFVSGRLALDTHIISPIHQILAAILVILPCHAMSNIVVGEGFFCDSIPGGFFVSLFTLSYSYNSRELNFHFM